MRNFDVQKWLDEQGYSFTDPIYIKNPDKRGCEQAIYIEDFIADLLIAVDESRPLEAVVKLANGERWIKVWDMLPQIGKPVIIKTDYGKCDICYLSVENNNRLLWTNAMRPQHTDGSVIEWKEIG